MNNSASDLTEEPAREIINPEPEGRAGAGITGGVIGVLSSGSFIALIVFAGIILAAYGYVIVRRRNFQNALERTLAEAK